MALEIDWGSGSPYAWRVLLALELKGVPYQSTRVDFSSGVLRSEEYRRLNPRGRVPALRDGDYTLYESLAILAYLDRKHPEPPLFGRTPEEAGLVNRLVSEYTAYLDPALESFILPLYFGRATEQADEVRKAMAVIDEELPRFEAAFGADSPWAVGGKPSAADLVLYPALASLERAASKEAARPFAITFAPVAARFPRLGRLMDAVRALPGYERTYPPHWK